LSGDKSPNKPQFKVKEIPLMKFFKLSLLIAALAAAIPLNALAVTGSAYPSYNLKNQFGETYINLLTGGSGSLDCQFIVNSTDAGGLGITGLQGKPCASVYMQTSATPAVGNPNPAAGYIVVNLTSQYYKFASAYASFHSIAAGASTAVTSTLTLGNPYIIDVLGSTTQANWQVLGVPAGVIPTVGAAFIATGATTGAGTGYVQAPGTTGVDHVEMVGFQDPNLLATAGAQLILRTLQPTSSSVTTLIPTAPNNSVKVSLHFVLYPLSGNLH
jgi:hypothetical protein